MAIYSLHHSSIGRSTHKPGTAAAHIRYISRSNACSALLGTVPEGVALERLALSTWLHACEADDRANGRVIDKLMVAIPRELSNLQRISLIETFCNTVTLGKVSWIAAIHQGEEDTDNPHAHIIIRDRDRLTGVRLINTSSKGSTEKFRIAWESSANEALRDAAIDAQVDRRSHEERGVDAAPSIHLGAAHILETKGRKTMKGHLHRRILTANAVLREASQIAREAEAALQNSQQAELMTVTSAIHSNGKGTAQVNNARKELELGWIKTKCKEGFRYENRSGSFLDDGKTLQAATGSAGEIQGMLLLAKAKGWQTIVTTGPPEFQRRVERAARAAGIAVYKPNLIEAETLVERLRLNAGRPGRERTR